MAIGLLGCGTVGSSVKDIIDNKNDYKIKYILTKNKLDDKRWVNDIDTIINDDEVDTIIEVMGGVDFAYECITKALKASKNVISANKAVIALYLEEFLSLAQQNNVTFMFEAAIGGGIPCVAEVYNYQQVDDILSFKGIFNGTCNYILTKMESEQLDFDVVLKQAQELGYAESNPDSDILGIDTKNKIAILASIISNKKVDLADIICLGINRIKLVDYKYLKGKNIRLFGYYEDHSLFVIPTIVDGIFKETTNNLNCVCYNSRRLADLYMVGQGAGGDATASAVVRDLYMPSNHNVLDDDCLVIKNDKLAKFYIRMNKEDSIDTDIIELVVEDEKYKYLITKEISISMVNQIYRDSDCFIAMWG